MAVRTDEVQLRIDFITDESRKLAQTLNTTKQYNQEIANASKEIANYQKQLAKANVDEKKREELLQKVADKEKVVATNLAKIAEEGKKVEKLDLNKVLPAQLVDRAKQLNAAMRLIPQSAPEFKKLQTELTAINAQLRQVKQNASGLSPEGSGGFNIAGLGTKALGAIGGVTALFAGLKKAIESSAELEQLNISFEVFLGSAEKAKEVIGKLKDFEKKTPFDSEQVNKAGRALLAFGFSTQELIPTLQAVGDVAAGTGKDFNELALIYGKAKAQGLIQGEELNQLAEAGIPIYGELAKVLGVSESQIRKLGEQGRINFTDLEKVFQNLTNEGGRFAGLMERQSQSAAGLFSTLKSVFDSLFSQIGTALQPAIKELLTSLIKMGTDIAPVIVPAFQAIGAAISGVVSLVKESVSLFSTYSTGKFKAVGDGVKNAILGSLAPVYDFYKAITGAKKIAEEAAASAATEAAANRAATEEELAAAAENEKKRLELEADRKKKAQEEAAKRAEAAFQRQLAANDAATKREELIQAGRFAKNVISEAQYQVRLSSIQEDGLRARLAIYEKFGRDQQNAALEIQNKIVEIETNKAQRRTDTTVSTLGSKPITGSVSSIRDNTDQSLGVAGIGNDAARVALRQKFEAALITEQDYQLRSLELKRAFIEEELAILRASTQPNIDEIKKREDAKLKIDEDIAKKKADNAARLQDYQDRIQAAGNETFHEGINLGIELLSKDAEAKKKHASVIKAFEIGVVTTQGISEVQKIFAKNAALPGGTLLSIAESAPAILRTIGSVVKITRQKFARGGDTGPGYGMADETGHVPVGTVHANEYVTPAWMRRIPEVRANERWLEAIRTRGYAQGGLVSVNTTPTIPLQTVTGSYSGDNSGSMNLQAAQLLYQAAMNFPRTVGASVSYLDIEDAGTEISTIRADAAI